MNNNERWVRRLYHFNLTQLALNTILLFLLGTWYVGLPTEEDANRVLEEEALPIAALPEGAFSSLDGPASSRSSTAPAAASAKNDPAMGALLAGAPPRDDGEESGVPAAGAAAPESGALPGSGGQGPAPASTGPINAYLDACSIALRRQGIKTGTDVSAYLPTSEQWAAAVGTGDFFNPKTIAVLEKLKQGFIATGATMPALPEPAGEDAPFNPAY